MTDDPPLDQLPPFPPHGFSVTRRNGRLHLYKKMGRPVNKPRQPTAARDVQAVCDGPDLLRRVAVALEDAVCERQPDVAAGKLARVADALLSIVNAAVAVSAGITHQPDGAP